MPLTDERIVHLARTNLARVTADIADPDLLHQFAAIDAALHELTLRVETSANRDWYRRGHALAREGLAHITSSAAAAAFATLADDMPAGTCSDAYQSGLAALNECLARIVSSLGASEQASAKDYLGRVCAWEIELPQRRGTRRACIDVATSSAGLTQLGLEQYLQRKFPQRRDLRVTDFEVVSGGFSKKTIFFTIVDEAGEEPLVLRANQPALNIKSAGSDVRNEYPLLLMVFNAGQPVPEPLWLESDESLFGVSFMVCRKALGKTIGSGHAGKAFQDITSTIRAELVNRLIQIHSLPANGGASLGGTHVAHWLPHQDLRAVAVASADFWMQELHDQGGVVGPSLKRLYDWLIENAPPALAFKPSFLHGDYGLHNILFEGERISAILDWEIAKVGDPAEDFTTLFISMGVDYDEELVRDYVAQGGFPVSRFRVTWYLLLILLRVLVFDAAAVKNLAAAKMADMNLFNWLTGTSSILLPSLNALIAKAEQQRAEEYR